MFLDPRVQCSLDADEKTEAKEYLSYLYKKIRDLNVELNINEMVEDVRNLSLEENDTQKNPSNVLELYMNSKHNRNVEPRRHAVDISVILNEFEKTPPLNVHANIYDFWEANKTKWPELYLLAQVLFSIPATEVNTERFFSHLNFILNKFRNKLSDESLEHILLIKLNPDMFYNDNV